MGLVSVSGSGNDWVKQVLVFIIGPTKFRIGPNAVASSLSPLAANSQFHFSIHSRLVFTSVHAPSTPLLPAPELV